IAGIVFTPLRHFLASILHAPGRFWRGAHNVGERMRQAFASTGNESLDRSGFSGSLAGTVSDLLTLRVRHAEASFRSGVAAFEQGDYEQARRKLSTALFWDWKQDLKPLHVLAHLHLGWLDEVSQDWGCAKKHYQQAAEIDPSNLPATLRLGMTHFRLGETGPAIFQLQRALELDPANLDTHYYLYAIYRRAKMENEALEQLRLIKAGESAQKLVGLFSRHGEEHFRMSRYAEALDDYHLALQFNPSYVCMYVALGDLYYLQEQPHTALETWCRGLWVGYAESLAERIVALAGQAVDVWPAVQLVRDCLSQHTEDGRYHFLLSRLLRKAGQGEEGTALLERAVQLAPQLLRAQEELGDLFSCMGHEEQASLVYRTGLKAARGNEPVYRCRICGYVTQEEQPRCFECNRWGTLEKMTQAEAQAGTLAVSGFLQRASIARRRLSSAWQKMARQLPTGD
ncbi:MAG: tetratricopeptide repeat protein, partial [Chloroflexi bacterium]|nr:tetratricopeptide repeat protein [Chloroflexota bacterium]